MEIEPNSAKTVFSPEHLAVIQKALKDDRAFVAPCSQTDRLAGIVASAQARGCSEFACNMALRGSYALKLTFGNYEGKRYTASVSFAGAYVKAGGKQYGFEVGMALMAAVESLILGVEGIGSLRRIVTYHR